MPVAACSCVYILKDSRSSLYARTEARATKYSTNERLMQFDNKRKKNVSSVCENVCRCSWLFIVVAYLTCRF